MSGRPAGATTASGVPVGEWSAHACGAARSKDERMANAFSSPVCVWAGPYLPYIRAPIPVIAHLMDGALRMHMAAMACSGSASSIHP